jgi:hypothetical protein
MSSPEDFQDITIKEKLEPVPDTIGSNIYLLPIVFSDTLPKQWVAAVQNHYDSCEHYMGEELLRSDQVQLARNRLPPNYARDHGSLESILFFKFDLEGGGPHPNTSNSIKTACSKANEYYRQWLVKEKQRLQAGEEKRMAYLEEKQQRDQRAKDATKDLFKD